MQAFCNLRPRLDVKNMQTLIARSVVKHIIIFCTCMLASVVVAYACLFANRNKQSNDNSIYLACDSTGRSTGVGINGTWSNWCRDDDLVLPIGALPSEANNAQSRRCWWLNRLPPLSNASSSTYQIVRAGWPLRMIYGIAITDGVPYSSPTNVVRSIGVWRVDVGSAVMFGWIPIAVYWPHLMANASLGYVASISVGMCVRRLRTSRRIILGRCAHCGYDRKGLSDKLPCPECSLLVPQHIMSCERNRVGDIKT